MNERRKILAAFEENAAYIEERANHCIENYRKGDFTLQITDEQGLPMVGAEVEVKQLSHDFKYGANLFMLDEFETEEKNRLYRQHFKEVCNIATLPFYWKDLEPEQGKPRFAKESPRVYRRPAIDLCMEYCEEQGIEPKEHCLFYETWLPGWLDKTNLVVMRREVENRFRTLAERYGERIPRWEVTNETLFFYENTSAMYYEPDLIEWCFACAEKYLPYNELVINDAHSNIWNVFRENRSAYYMQIERALAKGARIDSIGMQFHMFYPREEEYERTKPFYDPKRIYRVLDRYSDFGKPIQLTEITIPAYSTTAEDEAIQAELIRWLYTIWFGHESVEAIQYWNLVDGYAAFAPQGDMTAGENYYHGGLFRFDMTPKPAYHVIKELFTETWHTEEQGISDAKGMLQLRGFYGTYQVTVRHDGKTKVVTVPFEQQGEGIHNIRV